MSVVEVSAPAERPGFFRALVLGPDGQPDEQAIISIAGAAVFLGLEAWNVVHLRQPFDAQSFGIGFGAVMAATGAGLGLRARWGVKGNST